MANPAELLFNLLSAWNKPGTEPRKSRQDPQLENHRKAVRYLDEIEEILPILENDGVRVSLFKNYFPEWVKYVFNYPNNWDSQYDGKIDQNSLENLENLIGYANMAVPKLDIDKIAELRGYITSVIKKLIDDNSIPTTTRRSALIAARNILTALDELDSVGEFHLQKMLDSLAGSLVLVTHESKNTQGWQEKTEGFIYPFVQNVAAGAFVNLAGKLLAPLDLGLPQLPGQ